jgi:transposase InsO family protein
MILMQMADVASYFHTYYGPEFISVTLARRAEENNVELEFIKPGKPTQNSYVERFKRTYRDKVLNMYVFSTLAEVREITDQWIREYNEERPHDALDDLTPSEYLAMNEQPETLNYRGAKTGRFTLTLRRWRASLVCSSESG